MSNRNLLCCLIGFTVLITSVSHAAEFNDTNTGNWRADNADTWGQGLNVFPDAGDHVIFNTNSRTPTVAVDNEFGDAANDSTWGANSALNFANGATLTHLAGSTWDIGADRPDINGTGTFLNQGTLDLSGNEFEVKGAVTIDNEGLVTSAGFDFELENANSRFINRAGATIRGTNSLFRIFDNGSFEDQGGTIEANGGDTNINTAASASAPNVSSANTMWIGDFAAGHQVEVSGVWSELRGTSSGGQFAMFVDRGGFNVGGFALTDGGVIDIQGDGLGMTGGGGGGNFLTLLGSTGSNDGIINYAADRYNINMNNGTFTNNGTINQLNSAGLGQEFELRNGTLENNGSIVFHGKGAIEIDSSATLLNTATGVLSKPNTDGDSDTKTQIFDNGTIDNYGTIEVFVNELELNNSTVLIGGVAPGSNLTHGTYRVVAPADGSDTTTLDINGGVGANQFDTIGPLATVDLRGPNSVFDSINSVTTIQGTMLLSDNRVFTPNGGDFILDGGTVGGNGGVFDGNLTGTGTISPGLSAGETFVDGNYALLVGSTYDWELASLADDNSGGIPGMNWDVVTMQSGNADVGGTSLNLLFDLLDPADQPGSMALDPFWEEDHQWLVFQLAGGTNNGPSDFAGITVAGLPQDFDAGTFSTSLDDNGQIFLNFTAASAVIPEPATIAIWAMLGMGAIVFAWRKRRK